MHACFFSIACVPEERVISRLLATRRQNGSGVIIKGNLVRSQCWKELATRETYQPRGYDSKRMWVSSSRWAFFSALYHILGAGRLAQGDPRKWLILERLYILLFRCSIINGEGHLLNGVKWYFTRRWESDMTFSSPTFSFFLTSTYFLLLCFSSCTMWVCTSVQKIPVTPLVDSASSVSDILRWSCLAHENLFLICWYLVHT